MPKMTKEQIKQARADNKGNWEFSFFQKRIIPNEEQKIKTSMRPENSFNPALIHQYINPQPSKEEIIYEKSKTKHPLKKDEKIILENYLKKKDIDIKTDMEQIIQHGLNAKVTTLEGRTKFLLMTLDLKLKKKDELSVCNIYLRLYGEDFVITDDLKKEFTNQINKMNEVVNKNDLIELQFTKFYNQMPPLNAKGFQKFDPWQIEVVNNIDNNFSTIVSAPTSAGKTVLSGYATTKGKTLIVVPTDALVWQMASYVGGILDCDVPVVTQTYVSCPERDKLIDKLNNAQAIVGTPDALVDFLPLIKIDFNWVIYDEIHMIGKKEGSGMEIIIKILDKIPFLALSATIGNIKEMTLWFNKINPDRQVKNIVCDKRFFNLQKFYYNVAENELKMLHPFALINTNEIKDGTILTKNLQPTPPDTWELYLKIKELYGDEIVDLVHTKYFDSKERIHLFKANDYFMDLLEFLVANYDERVEHIVSSFKNINVTDNIPNLVDLALLLKQEKKTPAIIFNKSTLACLRTVREFAKIIEKRENDENPRLREKRFKEHKKAAKINKRKEKETSALKGNTKGNTDKKEKKALLGIKNKDGSRLNRHVPTKNDSDDEIELISINQPTDKYNFNDNQNFTEEIVEDWVKLLNPDSRTKYFPPLGNEYHFLITLLWRGVGVYAKGLPDAYLRLVQSLACSKKLGIVFSDLSLVFGVSMPFRTVVIYRDNYIEDDLDAMLYHQMSGRAGRRGLDKEGNVIFVGYKWKRIEELSICPIPNITGTNTLNYCVPHANKLSNYNWDNIFKNSLNGDNDEDNLEILASIKENYEGGWNFGISDDKNHLHMMWKMRHSDEESIITSFLIPYLKRGFESMDPKNFNNQIKVAHFLCHFIDVKKATKDENILIKCDILNQEPFSNIYNMLEELQLEIPDKIDGLVYESIRLNKIIEIDTEKETDELRNRLLFGFGYKVNAIQHFCFHNKYKNVAKLLAKLLTRIWWIYHTSSPIMKNFNEFDSIKFNEVSDDNDNQEEESDSSDDDSSDEDSSDEE